MKYNGDRSKESLVAFAMQHVRSTVTELSTGKVSLIACFSVMFGNQYFEFTVRVDLGHSNDTLQYLFLHFLERKCVTAQVAAALYTEQAGWVYVRTTAIQV